MVFDLLDAHLLAGKDMTEVDLARLEADAPAVRHREAEINRSLSGCALDLYITYNAILFCT